LRAKPGVFLRLTIAGKNPPYIAMSNEKSAEVNPEDVATHRVKNPITPSERSAYEATIKAQAAEIEELRSKLDKSVSLIPSTIDGSGKTLNFDLRRFVPLIGSESDGE
jgi:hypothetical protein